LGDLVLSGGELGNRVRALLVLLVHDNSFMTARVCTFRSMGLGANVFVHTYSPRIAHVVTRGFQP
jgi:hypothetical protein